MPRTSRSFAPRTLSGRLSVALGGGLLAVLVGLYVLSNSVTHSGAEAAPLWLQLLNIAGVLAVAVPAVATGLYAWRDDRSTLGTIVLVIACVVGAWAALAGVADLFLE